MNVFTRACTSLALIAAPALACAEPTVVGTEVLGPLTGEGAGVHPDNLSPEPIAWYGTDLGFTYVHEGQLHFIFGDSWATEAYAPIEASTGAKFDDGFATVDLSGWPDGSRITADNMPLLLIGQNAGTTEASAINPGHAMDLGHTPMAAFSTGEHEFGIFNLTKPKGCATDDDCGHSLSCDTGLGYIGVPFSVEENLTLPCVDGQPACVADTVLGADGEALADTGFCVDTTSSVWQESDLGRMAAAALNVRVGLRSADDRRVYGDVRDWPTNKFVNVTATTVQHFDPADPGSQPDFAPAGGSGEKARVFLWGRPGFISVNAKGRTLGLYFAYVDLPRGPDYEWTVHYFKGIEDGRPAFSTNQAEAAALDLDSTTAGVQAKEIHDAAQQMSVEWIEPLGKWVMLYSGGIITIPSPPLPNCGVLELFTRSDCVHVDMGNGAVRMRTADHPWGPWSPPQDVLVGGDPDVPGSGQYGPGGMLNHPECTAGDCAPHTDSPYYGDDEYGFLYSANIVRPWTTVADNGDVEIVWNASSWDPYRVFLARTRIRP